jgi:hypothetical protein
MNSTTGRKHQNSHEHIRNEAATLITGTWHYLEVLNISTALVIALSSYVVRQQKLIPSRSRCCIPHQEKCKKTNINSILRVHKKIKHVRACTAKFMMVINYVFSAKKSGWEKDYTFYTCYSSEDAVSSTSNKPIFDFSTPILDSFGGAGPSNQWAYQSTTTTIKFSITWAVSPDIRINGALGRG